VHCVNVSEVDLRTSDRACRVFQLTCSPFRNPLSAKERRIVRATASRASAIVFSALSRLAGVAAPSAEWQRLRRETFDNSIGELVLIEREASVTIGAAREREKTSSGLSSCTPPNSRHPLRSESIPEQAGGYPRRPRMPLPANQIASRTATTARAGSWFRAIHSRIRWRPIDACFGST
jgi:hypothetical protein